MDKSKITKSLAVFASVLLIIIIGVASFAYFGTFNVNLNNNVAVNINSSSPGNATFISNATQLNLQVPAANMSFTVANNTVAAKEDTAFLDVTLTGSQNLLTTCTYDIVYEYDAGSNVYGQGTTTKTGDATKEITIEVNGMNGNNHFATETNFDYANIQSYYDSANNYYKLVEGATIKSLGSTQSVRWKITGRYYNLEASQSQLDGKNFTGKIYAISKGCSSEDGSSVKKGYETILANNGGKTAIEAKTADFHTMAETNEGMYAAEDDLGTSYYFRGAVDNNWIKYGKYKSDFVRYRGYYDADDFYYFSEYNSLTECQNALQYNYNCTPYVYGRVGDDMYWRIIRINGDDSIRMIYSGTYAPDSNTKTVMDNYLISVGYSAFNKDYHSAEYVGYMYTLGEQHGTSKSSDIKTYLDNWYANYTNLNDDGTKLTDQIFCVDRSATNSTEIWSSTSDSYFYGASERIRGYPQLTCPVVEDRFTVGKVMGLGNSSLTYPVGMITMDEIKMAGNTGNDSIGNTNYYLYSNNAYWSLTPYAIYNNSAKQYKASDIIYTGYAYDSYAVRPVISLSSESKLLGNGTYNDVYTVS